MGPPPPPPPRAGERVNGQCARQRWTSRASARVEGVGCDRATRARKREVERASRREDAVTKARGREPMIAHTSY